MLGSRWKLAWVGWCCGWGLALPGLGQAEPATVPLQKLVPAQRTAPATTDETLRQQMVEKGIAFLRSTQEQDGSFAPQLTRSMSPAGTALAVTALLRNGVPVSDPAVVAGLGYLRQFQQPDGGFYPADSKIRNYETCLVCMCFAAARGKSTGAAVPELSALLERGSQFLKGHQWDEGEQTSRDDTAYGGAGYGSHERPDLSNTSFLVDTLRELGTSPQDEAIQRALTFVSRCQNLESPHNTTEFAAKNPDGGFYYTPAAGGNSQAGTTETGGLRSYASMTYAGLRSMIHAGVDRDDQRVVAAKSWLAQHYTLADNPGLGEQGLFYYYHTMAKTLATLQEPEFLDASGVPHAWQHDLIAELSLRQRPDGAWLNRHPRWLEDQPVLVTSYALLALSYCAP